MGEQRSPDEAELMTEHPPLPRWADRGASFYANVSGPPVWTAVIFFALIVLWLWERTQQ
jgi:hypothetical protein